MYKLSESFDSQELESFEFRVLTSETKFEFSRNLVPRAMPVRGLGWHWLWGNGMNCNHFQKCWDTSRFLLKYCKTSAPLAPYSMLSRGCHIFVLAIDTQTSNPTLNGGAGEGEVRFFDGIIVERQM